MSETIDLRKINVLTDSTYDTTNTQYSTNKKPMIYTTPFEQQAKYNMRSCNKPFQPSKYPSDGHEWYAKRAVNDVDLQTDMNKILPDQQVQNWSRTKSIIVQPKTKKETMESSNNIAKTITQENKEKIKRIKNRITKGKESYITSPFGEAEDIWSSAGKLKEIEKFTINGKEYETIDAIIVILIIVILIIGIYIYFAKKRITKEDKYNYKQIINDVGEPLKYSSDTEFRQPEKSFNDNERLKFNKIFENKNDYGFNNMSDFDKNIIRKYADGYRGGKNDDYDDYDDYENDNYNYDDIENDIENDNDYDDDYDYENDDENDYENDYENDNYNYDDIDNNNNNKFDFTINNNNNTNNTTTDKIDQYKTNGGETKTVNCGNLCGGAFDTKINI